MKRLFLSLGFLAGVVALTPACSSDPTGITTGTVASKLTEQFKKLSDNLGPQIALLKSAAITPAGVLAPSEFGEVAKMVKNLTGNLDIALGLEGKTGDKSSNIDGVGEAESVSIFVPNPPTGGTGTTASLPSFLAWKGDAESGDQGLCDPAWPKGANWFVVSKCGNPNGAYVCQITYDSQVCNACNTAGECNPCDMEQTSFTCAWP